MAEKWTNTSAPPPSTVMKPKPLSALNHFTVPCAMLNSPSENAGPPDSSHSDCTCCADQADGRFRAPGAPRAAFQRTSYPLSPTRLTTTRGEQKQHTTYAKTGHT